MSELIKLVEDYQGTKDDFIFEEIVNILNPLIYKKILDINPKYINDLYQEVLIKIYQIIFLFKIDIEKDSNVNEKQFISFIMANVVYTKKDFFKKKSFVFNDNLISLNQLNEKGIELINTIKENNEFNYFLTIDEIAISLEEKQFLKLYIENNQILSDKAVAKKLGITQQAVNKRKQKIIKKYNNGCKK